MKEEVAEPLVEGGARYLGVAGIVLCQWRSTGSLGVAFLLLPTTDGVGDPAVDVGR